MSCSRWIKPANWGDAMGHEFRIRFAQPPRTIRSGDPKTSLVSARQAAVDSANRALAAERESAEQERRTVGDVLARLAGAAQSLQTSRHELLGELQLAAVELALAVAARVTYDKLQSDRFAIEELVQAVVGRLDATGPVQVRLNPDYLALLQRQSGEGQIAGRAELQFVPDATLARGDCVVDAGDVSLASKLEDQLDGLRQHLLRNVTDASTERRRAATGDRELRQFPDCRQTA
jgi:flagellar assembly protein FliH